MIFVFEGPVCVPLPDPAARKRSPRLELSGNSGCGFAAVVFLPPAFLPDRAEAEPFAVLLAGSASGDGVRGGGGRGYAHSQTVEGGYNYYVIDDSGGSDYDDEPLENGKAKQKKKQRKYDEI